jgi:hypothetical protein
MGAQARRRASLTTFLHDEYSRRGPFTLTVTYAAAINLEK